MYSHLLKRLFPSVLLSAVLILSTGANSSLAESNLYEDLGGQKGMTAIVDQFLWNLADDERINHHFVDTNLSRFREKLMEFFCMTADGPCAYTGDTMLRTHANLDIKISDFNAVVEDLILSMEHNNISTGAQNRLLKRLALFYNEVVEVPAEHIQQ